MTGLVLRSILIYGMRMNNSVGAQGFPKKNGEISFSWRCIKCSKCIVPTINQKSSFTTCLFGYSLLTAKLSISSRNQIFPKNLSIKKFFYPLIIYPNLYNQRFNIFLVKKPTSTVITARALALDFSQFIERVLWLRGKSGLKSHNRLMGFDHLKLGKKKIKT